MIPLSLISMTNCGDAACVDPCIISSGNSSPLNSAANRMASIKRGKLAPTADLEELAPQKADEDALNLTYQQIDDFLEGKPVPRYVAERLIHIYQVTQHKRQPIPTIYDESL